MVWLTRFLLSVLALLVVARYVPGIVVDSFYAALIASVILGLLNLFVRPILVILTLPISILTLGLFIVIINALLFWFAASFIDGFAVESFGAAILGSLIVSLISALGNRYIRSVPPPEKSIEQ